jgi:hypothetical protein
MSRGTCQFGTWVASPAGFFFNPEGSSMNVVARCGASIALGLFLMSGMPLSAHAQQTQPAATSAATGAYYAVVSSESIPMRCGAGERFYAVSTLPSGSIVIVDQEVGNWSRVLYTSGAHAFVRAEDVRVDGSNVILTTDSRLRAPSQVNGYLGSWQVLLESALPSGTSLTMIEPFKEGQVTTAYKVQAPIEARGYIITSALRRATDADVSAYRASGKLLAELNATTSKTGASTVATGLPSITTPQAPSTNLNVAPGTAIDVNPVAMPTNPVSTPYTPTTTPALIAEQGLAIDVPRDAAIEAAKRAGSPTVTPTPRDTSIAQPAQEVNAASSPTSSADTGETSTFADPTTPPTTVLRVRAGEDLEPIFRKVWAQPVIDAEVDELIAQYEQAITSLGSAAPRRKAALDQRLEALRFRREYQATLRRQADDRAQLDQQTIRMQDQLREWTRTRVYTIVGTLQPSTVYDGQRLPSMYRVVSVGGTSPRTLGYIRKTDQLDLDRYLGQVVGVIGQAEVDRSLQLNLITPVVVDPLKSDLPAGIPTESAPALTIPPEPAQVSTGSEPASTP